MLALPWKEKDATSNDMIRKEVMRQLSIMKTTKPDSEEYKAAMARFKELHEHELKEAQVRENRRARWFDALSTLGLAVVTLTAEQWTPLTSKWFGSIMHPIRSKRDFKL